MGLQISVQNKHSPSVLGLKEKSSIIIYKSSWTEKWRTPNPTDTRSNSKLWINQWGPDSSERYPLIPCESLGDGWQSPGSLMAHPWPGFQESPLRPGSIYPRITQSCFFLPVSGHPKSRLCSCSTSGTCTVVSSSACFPGRCELEVQSIWCSRWQLQYLRNDRQWASAVS